MIGHYLMVSITTMFSKWFLSGNDSNIRTKLARIFNHYRYFIFLRMKAHKLANKTQVLCYFRSIFIKRENFTTTFHLTNLYTVKPLNSPKLVFRYREQLRDVPLFGGSNSCQIDSWNKSFFRYLLHAFRYWEVSLLYKNIFVCVPSKLLNHSTDLNIPGTIGRIAMSRIH